MRQAFILLTIVFTLTACGGKKNNPPPDVTPAVALLSSPAQNEVCTTGTVISATQSSVTFTWEAAANASSYDLTLKNLLTAATETHNTSQTQLTLTLARNTPYSWFIVSKSTQTSATAQSDTWKFYNSGPGIITYAPFPAQIVAPTFGQIVTAASGTVNLSWKGSSVTPGDIINYDVYFGTTNSPALLAGAVTASFDNNVAVTSGTTYYWKVITRDMQGNTSDSGLSQFTVK